MAKCFTMEFKQIQELLRAVSKSGLSEVSIKDGEFEIHVKQAVAGTNLVTIPEGVLAPVTTPQYLPQTALKDNVSGVQEAPVANTAKQEKKADTGNAITIKSPMIGTFYRSGGPDKPPFVNVGDSIKKGTVLCVVEAMKLFNEIESEVSGRIVKVLVEDASPVEYDQPLFLVEPE